MSASPVASKKKKIIDVDALHHPPMLSDNDQAPDKRHPSDKASSCQDSPNSKPGCRTKEDGDLVSGKADLKTNGLEHNTDTSSSDAKKVAASTAVVDVDELALDIGLQIQAMPEDSRSKRRSGTASRPCIPGAHAVGGRAPYLNPGRASTAAAQVATFPMTMCQDEEMALDAAIVEATATVEASETLNSADDAHRHSPIEVIEGRTMPDTQGKGQADHTKSLQKWIGLIFVISVIGVAVILVIVLTVGNEEAGEDSNDRAFSIPTLPSDEAHYPPFLDNLPADIVMEVEKHDTPECLANRWMWQDPYRDTYSRARQLQRFAMVVFYYYTKGDAWYHNDHWLDYEVSECNWYSAYNENDDPFCDQDSNLLIFDFHNNNLEGTLPGLTLFYPHLRWFNVGHNHLKGSPPPLASKLKDLEVFILSNNEFEGQLISDAGFVAFNVRVVKLDGNAFFGYVNPVFRVLPKLEILNLTSNAFANEVPFQLMFTDKLQYLGMADNQWYGTIPSELSALTGLQEMNWAGNVNIIGSIPTEFGALTSLQRLDVSRTQVTGSVPQVLCQETEQFPTLEIVANCSQVECCH